MSKKTRQTALNLTVLLIALLLSVLLAEVAVRLFAGEPGEEEWLGASRHYYEYDSLLGWAKIPNTNTSRVSVRGKYNISYQINSKSIRGPEYPYDKPDNEYRVLFLGDSFTEAYLVEFDSIFSEIVKSRLNDRGDGTHYEVINSGTAGWGTDQELLFFQDEGKKYKPDLTVLVFYQNDLTYNNQPKDWGMYYKPLFKEQDGELVLTNVPVPKPDKIVNYDQLASGEESVFKKVRSWLHTNSHLYEFVKNRLRSSQYLRSLAVKYRIMDKPVEEEGLLPREYNLWQKQYNDMVTDSWKITETLIVKLNEEIASSGSRLLVYFIPHEASIYRKEWTKLKKKYGFSDDEWDIDQVGKELGAVCARNGIDYINPTEVFRVEAEELDKTGERLYEPVDHHWNGRGNQLTGKILADYIETNFLNKAE